MPMITLPSQNLDENSPTPLYFQLQELIATTIKASNWGLNCQLPSERELATMYGLSRMTVRQAMTALVNDGLVVRRRGKGTYIAPPKLEYGLLHLTSFAEDMKQRGLRPSTRLIAVRQLTAIGKTARVMGLTPGSVITLIERIRLANDQPMAYELCHLPQERFPNILEEEVNDGSLYDFILNKYNVKPFKAEQTCEATIASPREADFLQIKSGAPLLLLERVSRDNNDRVVEFARALVRGDKYKFSVDLRY